MKTFGNSVGRLEDPDLLAGRACFADDILLGDELHAAFVRSPHGHAAIERIDCAAALALDGVHAIYTAADFAPHLKIDRLVVRCMLFLRAWSPPCEGGKFLGNSVGKVLRRKCGKFRKSGDVAVYCLLQRIPNKIATGACSS